MHIIVFQLKTLPGISLRFSFKENFTDMHVYLMVSHLLQEFFTKIMKSVLSTLRKIDYSVMSYLDDIFICGDTFEECRDAVLATVNLLLKLGFSIHPQKSQLIPVQKIEYLGFLIDSVKMKISLAKLKQDKLNNLIAEISNSSKLRIRDVFKVLCSFEAALPAITNRCFYMFYLQN